MKTRLAALALIVAVVLSGCSTTDLYHRLFIKGIAVDKAKDSFEVTVRVENFKTKEEETLSAKGESIYDAVTNLSLITGKNQMYSHSFYVIYGKELAKNDIRSAMDFFIRYYRSHPSIKILIADGKASDIITAKKNDKLISSEEIRKFEKSEYNCGKTVSVTLREFVAQSENISKTTLAPVISKDEMGLGIYKTAVFTDYELKTEISDDDTMGIKMARGEIEGGAVVAENEELGLITAEILDGKSKLTCPDENHLNLDITLSCGLASMTYTGRQNINCSHKVIEKLLEEEAEKYVSTALKKTYAESTDVLDASYVLYKIDFRKWDRIQKKWFETLPDIECDINVNVDLKRLGEEDKPPY